MITIEECKKIVESKEPNYQQQIEVLRFYIKLRKNEELLEQINLPTGKPCIINMQMISDHQLLDFMFSNACDWLIKEEFKS